MSWNKPHSKPVPEKKPKDPKSAESIGSENAHSVGLDFQAQPAKEKQKSEDQAPPAQEPKPAKRGIGRNIQADYREHPKFSKFKKGSA